MLYLSNPLKVMRETQKFGVNWTGVPDFYSKLGIPSGLHNGLDLSAVIGTPICAECDGRVESGIYDDGCRYVKLWSDCEEGRIEICHLHCSETAPSGMAVKRGDQIGLTGNTGGASTGPHLHLGVRKWDRVGNVIDRNNGYWGFIDPSLVFPKNWLDLPVDRKYGMENDPHVPSVLAFAPSFLYFIRTTRRAPTTREYNALRYGFYDIRTVLDPAMWQVWTAMTKLEAKSKKLI